MNQRKGRKSEPNHEGGEHWGLDPQDVRRHARRMRQARTVGPLGKVVRVVAVALVFVGAFALTWNFDLLRRLSFDFSALTDTFSRNDAPAGARPSDEPGTEVIGDSSIAGGVSLPTSIKTDEPDPAEVEAPEEAPAEAPQAAPAAPGDAPTSREPDPAEPAAPASPETEPVVAAANEAPAVPPPPPEPEVPVRPETFGFGVSIMHVSEANPSAGVLVLRDGGRRGVSFITWWTTDGTATAGSDFAQARAARRAIRRRRAKPHAARADHRRPQRRGLGEFLRARRRRRLGAGRRPGRANRGRHHRRRLARAASASSTVSVSMPA